jgi:hypothetical protein
VMVIGVKQNNQLLLVRMCREGGGERDEGSEGERVRGVKGVHNCGGE